MDAKTLPVIDLKGVKAITTLSRSSIYALAKNGMFPKPLRIAGTSRTVWRTTEVLDWLDKSLTEEAPQ